MKSKHLYLIAALSLAVVQSCASADVADVGGSGGSSHPGGNNGGGGQGGNSFVLPQDASALTLPDVPKSLPDLPPCPTGYRQDDAGNFFCCPTPLRILSFGQPAKYGSGSGDSTDAFQAFMNGNTNGTAKMEMRTTYKALTADDLANYDLVILQALWNQIPYNPADLWTFTDGDAAVLRDWVKKGGALVSLSGYWSDQPVEIQPLNKLLSGSDSWTGISYNGDDTFNQDSCPDGLCYCSRGSIPFNNWLSTADCNSITTNSNNTPLGKVGVFRGRSINCSGSGCNVFAKDPKAGGILGAAKIIGDGRVLAWGDEWVTYTSQWGLVPDKEYDDPQKAQQCVGHTPMTSYVVPQFWYNVFRWLVPGNTCFTIIVPPDAPPGQQVIL